MANLSEILADVEGYVSSHYPDYIRFLNGRSYEFLSTPPDDRDDWWNFWYPALRASTQYICQDIWETAEHDIEIIYSEYVANIVVDLFAHRFPDSEVYLSRLCTEIANSRVRIRYEGGRYITGDRWSPEGWEREENESESDEESDSFIDDVRDAIARGAEHARSWIETQRERVSNWNRRTYDNVRRRLRDINDGLDDTWERMTTLPHNWRDGLDSVNEFLDGMYSSISQWRVDWGAFNEALTDKGFTVKILGTRHLDLLYKPHTYINDVWKEYRSWARANGLPLDVSHTNIRRFLAHKWGLKFDPNDVAVDEGRLVTVTVGRRKPEKFISINFGFSDAWDIIKEDAVGIWNEFAERYNVLKSFDWKYYFMTQLQEIVDEFVKMLTVDPIYLACCLLDTGLTLENYVDPKLLSAIGRILQILTYSPYIGLSFGFDFMKAINESLSFMIRTGWVIFLKYTVFNAVAGVWYKIDQFLYELGMCIVDPERSETKWCKDWMAILRCIPLMDFLYYLYNKLTGIKNSILSFYFQLLDDLRFRELRFLGDIRAIFANAININIINKWRGFFNKLLAIVDALTLCISSADVQDYRGRFRGYRMPIVPTPGGEPSDEEHISTSGHVPGPGESTSTAREFYRRAVGGIDTEGAIEAGTSIHDVIATVVPNELYRRLVEWYNFVQEHVHTESKDECDRRLITGLFKLMEDLYE